MAEQTSQRDRDALIAAVLALFLLTDADEAAFEEAIYQARVDAVDAAIAAAANAAGVDVSEYQPPDSLLQEMAADSTTNAASIVQTWNTDITAEAEQFMAANPTADEAALKADLQGWSSYRAQWKSDMISQYESSKGYSAGVDQFVSDLLAGDLELPDGTSIGDLVVTVYPAESSMDECEVYAGNSYALDDPDVPLDYFPAHANCPHFCQIEFAS